MLRNAITLSGNGYKVERGYRFEGRTRSKYLTDVEASRFLVGLLTKSEHGEDRGPWRGKLQRGNLFDF